jgi:putative inorganic carbon (HCO3(-)) transporter
LIANARSARGGQTAAWALIGLLAGVLIGLLPPGASALVLLIGLLGVLSLIDLRVALVVTLTVAPLKALMETESRVDWPLDIGQLAFLALIGIWLARSIAARRRLDLLWTPVYVPVGLFALAASFSLWVALSPGNTLTELLKWMEMLAMIGLVVSLMVGRASLPAPLHFGFTHRHLGGGANNLHWMVGALILSAVIQGLIGLYQFFGGSGAAHLWILDYRYFRAFGTFGQPNPFGAFMGLTLPLALGATLGAAAEAWSAFRQRKPIRGALIGAALYAGGAAIIGIGLLISWSRGAWIGFGAAVIVLVLFGPRRRWIGVTLVAIGLFGGVAGAAAGVLPASLAARFSDFTQDLSGFADVRGQVISDTNYAVLERFAHWQAALSMANDSPWLGVGFGNYEVAYPRYALMNWPMALGHAHNYYLNLLAETGIIGLSAYVAAWIAIFWLTVRTLRQQSGFGRGLALGLLGVWTHLAVHSLFDKLYVNNIYLHLGAMLGLIGGLVILGNLDARYQKPN